MTEEEIKSNLVQVLIDVQVLSGRGAPNITDRTCPIGDLESFDSLNAVEAASLLSDALGHDINPKLLLPATPHQSLAVREIVHRISESLGTAGGISNEQG